MALAGRLCSLPKELVKEKTDSSLGQPPQEHHFSFSRCFSCCSSGCWGSLGLSWGLMWGRHIAGLVFWLLSSSPCSCNVRPLLSSLRYGAHHTGGVTNGIRHLWHPRLGKLCFATHTDVLLCGRVLFHTKQPSHGIFDRHL